MSKTTETTTIGFSSLSDNIASGFTGYSQGGYEVTPVAGAWTVSGYGDPGPAVEFSTEAGGQNYTLEVTGKHAFSFSSVDLYSSVTPIPYTLVGKLNGQTVFTSSGTVPNTYGTFVTVSGPDSKAAIDTLDITLTSVPTSAGTNPYGVDSIVLSQPGHGGREDFGHHGGKANANSPVTLGFDSLSNDVGTQFTGYSQSGFKVTPILGGWTVYGDTGGTDIGFFSVIDGQSRAVEITDGGRFIFDSVDLYATVTPMPYTLVGKLNGQTVFTSSGTLTAAQGNFATLSSPDPTAVIDALDITLSPPSAFGLGISEYQLDNIVVTPAGHSTSEHLGNLFSSADHSSARDLLPDVSQSTASPQDTLSSFGRDQWAGTNIGAGSYSDSHRAAMSLMPDPNGQTGGLSHLASA